MPTCPACERERPVTVRDDRRNIPGTPVVCQVCGYRWRHIGALPPILPPEANPCGPDRPDDPSRPRPCAR